MFNGTQSLGFQSNASSTYQAMTPSSWDLIMEQGLGIDGQGDYGFDTVRIGTGSGGANVSEPQLTHQVIAGFAIPDFWLGFFPLSEKASNFTSSYPSYLSTLAAQSQIPSLSFGYTAGAQYQDKGALGSLTLGGYDASKITPGTNMSFSFASDDSRSLTVGLQSITAQRTLQGTVAPLASGILAFIDSGVPEIWLPQQACAIFEEAFGLIYDNQTELYLLNTTTHTQLLNLNSSITFNLGNQANGGSTIAIELPYAAFDLQRSYPTYYNATNYFPLRRAANDTQYVLGRTFLQEAYITVDYERQNFSVGQVAFSAAGQETITPILSINATNTTSTASSTTPHHLSSNAIAGITIAATVSLFLLALFIYYLIRRYRYRRQMKPRQLFHDYFASETDEAPGPDVPRYPGTAMLRQSLKHEMPTGTPVPPHHLQSQRSRLKRNLSPSQDGDYDDEEEGTNTKVSEMHSGGDGDVISPLSPAGTRSTTTNELETPIASAKPSMRQMRQELYGSSAAAEAHTSIWGGVVAGGGGRDGSGGGISAQSYDREEHRAASAAGTRSRSESDTSGGGASIGVATMEPIYELSAESQLGGVRIKPILRQYRH